MRIWDGFSFRNFETMPCCFACVRGESLLTADLSIAAKSLRGFLNAAKVGGAGRDIQVGKGDLLENVEGYFQSIEVVEAFDILDSGNGNSVVGSWTRTTTTSHVNSYMVLDPDDRDTLVDVVEDSAPTDPDHFVSASINYDDSSVTVSGQVLRGNIQSFLQGEIGAEDWKTLDDSVPLVWGQGGLSGLYIPGDPEEPKDVGDARISKIRYGPVGYVFEGGNPESGVLTINHVMELTAKPWIPGSSTTTTKTEAAAWDQDERAFTNIDRTDPLNGGWADLPFDLINAHSVDILQPSGNLWPLF